MIKDIISRMKEKAIKDDNDYWFRQEEWIQRKNCRASFGEKCLYFSLGLLMMSIVKLFV